MELTANPFNKSSSLRKYWRRRRGYRRLDSANRKTLQVERFGGNQRRTWRIRVIPKLRLRVITSPIKLWRKIKNAYINMMFSFANNMNSVSEGITFGGKPISKTKNLPKIHSNTEFDDRLIYEIYKTLMASRELATTTT